MGEGSAAFTEKNKDWSRNVYLRLNEVDVYRRRNLTQTTMSDFFVVE